MIDFSRKEIFNTVYKNNTLVWKKRISSDSEAFYKDGKALKAFSYKF